MFPCGSSSIHYDAMGSCRRLVINYLPCTVQQKTSRSSTSCCEHPRRVHCEQSSVIDVTATLYIGSRMHLHAV